MGKGGQKVQSSSDKSGHLHGASLPALIPNLPLQSLATGSFAGALRANTSLSLPSAKEDLGTKSEAGGLGCPGMHTSSERGCGQDQADLHATWGSEKSLWGLPDGPVVRNCLAMQGLWV